MFSTDSSATWACISIGKQSQRVNRLPLGRRTEAKNQSSFGEKAAMEADSEPASFFRGRPTAIGNERR
jgi:hypothetical protein